MTWLLSTDTAAWINDWLMWTYWSKGFLQGRTPHVGIRSDTHTSPTPWWGPGCILDSLCSVPLCPTWTDPRDRLKMTEWEIKWEEIIHFSSTNFRHDFHHQSALCKIVTFTVSSTDLGQTQFANTSVIFFPSHCTHGGRWFQIDRQLCNESHKLR